MGTHEGFSPGPKKPGARACSEFRDQYAHAREGVLFRVHKKASPDSSSTLVAAHLGAVRGARASAPFLESIKRGSAGPGSKCSARVREGTLIQGGHVSPLSQ